jgi:hypothetical protein
VQELQAREQLKLVRIRGSLGEFLLKQFFWLHLAFVHFSRAYKTAL